MLDKKQMSSLGKISAILIAAISITFQFKPATVSQNVTEITSINDLARGITVLIKRYSLSPQPVFAGSGVLFARSGRTYYVLTAKHVVDLNDSYQIVTEDGNEYKIDYSDIIPLKEDLDLAVLIFTSYDNYDVARLGNSDLLYRGSSVYLSGWVKSEKELRLTFGEITNFRNNKPKDGYSLIYNNKYTSNGMSGGPLLNNKGCLVGIHGRRQYIPGWGQQENGYLGIPINKFLYNNPQTIDFLVEYILQNRSTDTDANECKY